MPAVSAGRSGKWSPDGKGRTGTLAATSRSRNPVPVRVERAQGGGRAWVGWQAKKGDRRCTPLRPLFRLAERADEPPQPPHRTRASGRGSITRARNDRNRHQSCDLPPRAPLVKLWQNVLTYDPDETETRVSTSQLRQRIDGEAGAGAALEIEHPNWSPRRHRSCGGKARLDWRHVGGRGLQRIARGDQPPHFVEPQGVERAKADPPVPAMRGIEGAAEKPDARHERARLARSRRAA